MVLTADCRSCRVPADPKYTVEAFAPVCLSDVMLDGRRNKAPWFLGMLVCVLLDHDESGRDPHSFSGWCRALGMNLGVQLSVSMRFIDSVSDFA